MAKLTAAERKRIPSSEFALAGRKYPIQDRAHAANAKARATQQYKAGHLSIGQMRQIKAKANAKLHK